jgi:hypothetical protein
MSRRRICFWPIFAGARLCGLIESSGDDRRRAVLQRRTLQRWKVIASGRAGSLVAC